MSLKPKIRLSQILTNCLLRTIVPVMSLAAPIPPAQGLVPSFSAFEVKYADGNPHPVVSVYGAEPQLKRSLI